MGRGPRGSALVVGPGLRWCRAHGAVGTAALLRCYLRVFEFVLDWYEHANYGRFTAADETRLYRERQSKLYINIHNLTIDRDMHEKYARRRERRERHATCTERPEDARPEDEDSDARRERHARRRARRDRRAIRTL